MIIYGYFYRIVLLFKYPLRMIRNHRLMSKVGSNILSQVALIASRILYFNITNFSPGTSIPSGTNLPSSASYYYPYSSLLSRL